MAKVKFFCDSGANIHSARKSGVLDTVTDLCMDEGKWESMSDDDKYKIAVEWANDRLDIWYEEVED